MSDSTPTTKRRRRADARQNAEAILAAAEDILGLRPEAAFEEIAKGAGVSRQTVYAHFSSREALIEALYDRITERVVAAVAAADPGSGPASAALSRLLEAAWHVADPTVILDWQVASTASVRDRERHDPIIAHLRAVVVRGQRRGGY